MRVLTLSQMREADARACAQIGEVQLMRAAGERVADAAARYARSRSVVAFAGAGNNGGDAFAA
ncbi:MAG TPA: NAD(P)H-hydrate epimerase, partial [Candidatus Baltobacteraceae bacterium]